MDYRYIVLKKDIKEYIYDYIYKELNNIDFAIFDNICNHSILFRFIYRICFRRLGLYMPKFIKKLWLVFYIKYLKRLIYKRKWENRKICFLLDGDFFQFEQLGFNASLRKYFCNCKIVYFFSDLIKTNEQYDKLLQARSKYDLIYSFDYSDAQKYNLKFHNIPYSDLSGMFENVEQKYDISFVGKAKDRLEEIIYAYKVLKKQELKLGFFITDVPKEKQILADEINYCNFIPYKDYLRIVAESKCILEIMQKGGTGSTVRVGEAISFEKLLISNNKMLLQNSFYDSKYMKVYENLEEINVKEFIDSNQDVHYKNKNKIYPSSFLKQIDRDLKEKL